MKFIKEIFKEYSSNSNIAEKIIDNNHSDFLLIEPTFFLKGHLINRSEGNPSKNNNETIRIEQIRNIKKKEKNMNVTLLCLNRQFQGMLGCMIFL